MDSNGEYKLFVESGTYNLVVCAEAKTPDFRKISTTPGQVLEGATAEYFMSGISAVGTVDGEITISGAGDEQHATLIFRQEADCAECTEYEKIEIKAINVANNSQYVTGLPVGTYSLTVFSDGYLKQNPDDFEITDGGVTTV